MKNSIRGTMNMVFKSKSATSKSYSLPVGRGNFAPCDIFASKLNSISHLINKAILTDKHLMTEHFIQAVKMAEGVKVSGEIIKKHRLTAQHFDNELLRTRIVPHLGWLKGAGKSTYNFRLQLSKVHGQARGNMIADKVAEYMTDNYDELITAMRRRVRNWVNSEAYKRMRLAQAEQRAL